MFNIKCCSLIRCGRDRLCPRPTHARAPGVAREDEEQGRALTLVHRGQDSREASSRRKHAHQQGDEGRREGLQDPGDDG